MKPVAKVLDSRGSSESSPSLSLPEDIYYSSRHFPTFQKKEGLSFEIQKVGIKEELTIPRRQIGMRLPFALVLHHYLRESGI